jgi:hypothetical protein
MMPTTTEAPDLISTGIQTVLDTTDRLGLTWQLRVGTVVENPSVDLLRVRIDGDESIVSMVSMIGKVPITTRVYVLSVPPAGNFITGMVNRIYPSSRLATTTRVTNSAGFTTTETVTDSVTATLYPGAVHRVVAIFLAQSSAAGDFENARIREDSLAGAQLTVSRVSLGAAGAGFVTRLEVEVTPTTALKKTYVLTGQRVAGTGTIIHAAGTNAPTYLFVEYVRC